jgi:signal transduction histidine kinase
MVHARTMVNNWLAWVPGGGSLPRRAAVRFAAAGADVGGCLRTVAQVAWSPVRAATRRLSLATRFLLASFVVLVLGMLVIGSWVGAAIERGVLNHSAAVTALYVNSVLGDYLEGVDLSGALAPADQALLDRLLTETPLGEQVVLFKVWSADGLVLYSPDQRLIGRRFDVDEGLDRAKQGEVSAELSDLDEPENAYERERWDRLLEVYAPVRGRDGNVHAVVEFYQRPDELEEQISAARWQSWEVVAAVMLGVFLVLAGIVKGGSDTIARQQRVLADQEVALRQRVSDLSELLDQNERLHERLRQAAGRTTALNEQSLRRIGADLHDGPCQALGLALLQLDLLGQIGARQGDDLGVIKGAVQDALGEIRSISAGLRLPELAPLGVREVAERAVRGHERRSGTRVRLSVGDVPADAPLPIKITLFRALEEALSNGTRHGGGVGLSARVYGEADGLSVTVSDQGPGFAPDAVPADGHLGLANMRERAEVLGGTFQIKSAPGQGATVHLWMPTDRIR